MEKEGKQGFLYGMGKKLRREIMNYCDPEGFRNEIKEIRTRGREAFFTWFDGGGDVDGAFEKAEDIFDRLMLPWAESFIGNLDERISLDIGYGGGGQVLAASEYFKYALGIDVHNEISFVEMEFKSRKGNKNTALFISQGSNIPIDDNKVDFIHSWVTFLHIGTIQNVENYLKEMFRVMTEGGIAVIFFTRLIRSKNVQNLQEYEADLKLEQQHPTGYREGGPLTLVNRANLVISQWKMKELVEKHGFKFILVSFSHDEDRIYGQHGIVFQKPEVTTTTIVPKREPKKVTVRKTIKKGKNKNV